MWTAWLTVEGGSAATASAIASSDRIVLPATALHQLQDRMVQGKPLLLRAASRKIAKADAKVTCSVHDFSADDNTAIVPAWLRKQLGITPGSKIWLEEVEELPTAEFCKLKVDGEAFFKLQNHKAVLERALEGNYRTLTEGATISVEHLGMTYNLTVVELLPEYQCSLLDSDLEVDLTGTVTERQGLQQQQQQQQQPQQQQATTLLLDKTTGTTLNVTDKDFTVLDLKLPTCAPFQIRYEASLEVSAHQRCHGASSFLLNASLPSSSLFCSFPRQKLTSLQSLCPPTACHAQSHLLSSILCRLALHALEQAPSGGDVDMYAASSTTTSSPSRRRFEHTCSEGDYDRRGTITVAAPTSTEWRVAVRAYGCDKTAVTLWVSSLSPEQAPVAEGQGETQAQQGQGTAAAATGGGQAVEGVPLQEMKVCDNCGREVPAMSYTRHTAFCRRHNVVCDRCGRAVRKGADHFHCDACEVEGRMFACDSVHARDKHNDLFHTQLHCDCGEALPMLAMQEHKAKHCPLRVMTCRFCFNEMRAGAPARDARDRLAGLTQHESECGSRTETCAVCGARVRLKDMDIHQGLHQEQEQTRPHYGVKEGGSAMDVGGDEKGSDAISWSPPQRRSDRTFVAKPATDPHELARMRAHAWARAGFDYRVPELPPQQPAAHDGSSQQQQQQQQRQQEKAKKAEQARVVHPAETRTCVNQLCQEQTTSDLGVCRRCRNRIAELSGVTSDTTDKKEFVRCLVKAYYNMAIVGCGNSDCKNEYCCSSSKFQGSATGTELAAQCLQRAQQYVASSPVVYVCTS